MHIYAGQGMGTFSGEEGECPLRYVLKNCRIIDGTGSETVRENAAVWVRNGCIRKITDADTAGPDGYETIDLEGKYVLPGLINMHAHLSGTGRPARSVGGEIPPKAIMGFGSTRAGSDMLRGRIKSNMKTVLHSGVTTVRGVGDLYCSDIAIRDLAAEGRLEAPRMLVSGPAVTVPGGYGDGMFAITGSTLEELRLRTEDVCDCHPDLIKTCVTGGILDAKKEGEPGELKMSLEQTKAVCDAAHARGLKVASHTQSSEGIRVALRGGADTIEHGAPLDEELIDLFKERGAAFICTLSPVLPLAELDASVTRLPPMAQANSRVAVEGMISGAKTAMAHGIPVGLGTDASRPFVSQYNTWAELYWFAKYTGVSNAYAIFCGTLQNARILGIADETGSVEEGKAADLIVVKDNPLDDLRALRHVEMVSCGKRLIRDPQVKRIPVIEEQIDRLL